MSRHMNASFKMAGAARQRLPSGHEDEFVNEVEDDFQCLICHLPLKEPVLTRCGHRFCKGCLEEHFRRYDLQYNSERKLIICKLNFSWNLVSPINFPLNCRLFLCNYPNG